MLACTPSTLKPSAECWVSFLKTAYASQLFLSPSLADIGEFLERPIKAYSSGLILCLAFAVVAKVDADVLVIDDGLAVGDAFFPQNCMRFLVRFRLTGTLLVVSHFTGAVLSLCDRAVLLMEGRFMDTVEVEVQAPAQAPP